MLCQGVDLVGKDIGGKSDPYVILRCGQSQAKSSVKSNTVNPVWNETFILT